MLGGIKLKDSLKVAGAGIVLALTALPRAAFAAPFDLIEQFGFDARSLLVAGIFAGSMVFAVFAGGLFLRAAARARRAAARSRDSAEQLNRKRAVLQALIAAEPQMLVQWDGDASPVLAAATLDAVFGVPATASDLARFSSWLKPDCAHELEEKMRRLLEAGESFSVDVETLGGARLEAIGRASAAGGILKIRDVAGEMEQIAAPGNDAAALETAQSALSRQFEENTRTLDRIATAVAIFSPAQRLQYHNQAFADLWDLEASWLAGKPGDGEILDYLRQHRCLPEQADYRDWKQKQLGRYESTCAHEDRWHLPDGRTIQVVANFTADGGATYLYENITEQLALKSRYNELIHVQKETLDHLREGVAVFASDGRLKLFNPAFVKIWKLNVKALADEPHIDEVIGWCRVLLDDDNAWVAVKRAITSIDDIREAIEGHLSRPDGSKLAYAGLPLPDGATLLTYVDITDSKRAENALIERNEALMAAGRLKSAFISHVSYELRTPLTNIIGFAELLTSPKTGELNERQREYLGDIQSSSDDLLTIINDILDLATIDAGTLELSLVKIRTKDVIDAAIVGVRERLKIGGLDLQVRVAADVQEFVADAKRLTQVLFNLLSNAIGFSEPGGTITIECKREGDMVSICVEDTGRGIPEEYQGSAFDRFETHSQGSHHRGAGLGLAIVKNLVELHGGAVSLRSAPGVGTSVTARLPVKGAVSVPAAAE